jgi:mannose-1-phosphate guanylyltransferase / mannose-6-phosphate isomerase
MTQISTNIHAVILAGGSGTRFWPLSRETYPKQMLQIVGEDTLLRQTIKRIKGFVPPENIWIVTTEDKAQDIRFHLEPFGQLTQKIRFTKEPLGRNTAPAIGLNAIYLNQVSPDSIMIVMPSDHAISENEKFLSDLKVAIEGAKEDYLVTFGIKPSRPETGYGYIKVDYTSKIKLKGVLKAECFVEKPDLETARRYVSDGGYFWNSGIFVWKTSKVLSEIEKHLPDLYKGLKEMESLLFEPGQPNEPNEPNKLNKLNELYASLESISIDYGIMERSPNVLVVPATFEWSDLGSWTALDELIKKDDAGNIVKGNTVDIGSQNSTIFAGERLVATIGLKDMVVVDTPDATLVTPKERVQEVRNIVKELKKSGREEHLLHKTVERPWGSYTVLEKGNGYKIKRVVLKPGAKLSLQLHRRRSEHWVVVSGVAKVTRESETYLVRRNKSTYIPINTKHRLENPGEELLQIIEVQNGDYVEEDDIERFSDDYGRI